MSEYKDYNWQTDGLAHTMSYILPKLEQFLPQDSSPILDVGCGNGSLVNFLLSQGYNAYGVDASRTGIAIAKRTSPDHFFIQDLTKDELPKELMHLPFKTIISTEVIEHLYNPDKYVEFCEKILKKSGGGQLILTTPYHGYLKNLVLGLLNAWDGHFTTLRVGGHIKFFSKKTISQLLENNGFEVKDFRGCGRLPYLWKSMLIVSRI